MAKKNQKMLDYIKANRKGSREAEIENHSHPVNFCRVHKSKKVYDRKLNKAENTKVSLPYLFIVRYINCSSFAVKIGTLLFVRLFLK